MSKLLAIYELADQENRRTISGLMLPAPGGVLLDVGCGAGADAIRLGAQIRADHAIGLEMADDLMEAARERGVDVRRADLSQRWPIEDESVDALHSNQVIEHLAHTDHFMREVRRVIKPSGYAVLSTNNFSSWHNVVALLFGWQPLPCHVSDEVASAGSPVTLGDEETYAEGGHRHLRIFTNRALADLAAYHGLALDRAAGAGYYPLGPRGSRMMARLDRTHSVYLAHRYRRT
jgi:SAM-dependent methyltransferase